MARAKENEVAQAIRPETLRLLVKLQDLDKSIAEIKGRVALEPAEVTARRKEAENAKKVARDAKESALYIQRKIDEKNVESKQVQADALKLEGQLYTLKTNEEFTIMKGQIAAKKAADTKLQDQMLEYLVAIDELRALQKKAEKDAERVEQEFIKFEVAMRESTARMSSGATDLAGDRAALAASLESDILDRYEAIRRRHDGVGIAAVEDEMCTACDTQVRLQLINKLMAGHLLTCPHCERIIFLKTSLAG